MVNNATSKITISRCYGTLKKDFRQQIFDPFCKEYGYVS